MTDAPPKGDRSKWVGRGGWLAGAISLILGLAAAAFYFSRIEVVTPIDADAVDVINAFNDASQQERPVQVGFQVRNGRLLYLTLDAGPDDAADLKQMVAVDALGHVSIHSQTTTPSPPPDAPPGPGEGLVLVRLPGGEVILDVVPAKSAGAQILSHWKSLLPVLGRKDSFYTPGTRSVWMIRSYQEYSYEPKEGLITWLHRHTISESNAVARLLEALQEAK